MLDWTGQQGIPAPWFSVGVPITSSSTEVGHKIEMVYMLVVGKSGVAVTPVDSVKALMNMLVLNKENRGSSSAKH